MLLWLDCFSGISGDMLLGALVDAGLDLDALRAGLAALPLAGYTLETAPTTEHGLSGARLHVRLDAYEKANHVHRRLADITALLDGASLPERAYERALAVFRRLAEAEATIHGTTPGDVTFHEVGAVDSIVDIVGAALALELLDVTDVYCSELPLTSGRVSSAHGALPVPAPATLELLKGAAVVWRPVPAEGELVTPTGAALVATLARFERPALRVSAVGYGFGARKMPWANCLRVVLGSAPEQGNKAEAGFERDEVTIIEANIDTMTGEALGWLLEHLLAQGALDVSYIPLQMKKNRPATLLTVIARPEDASELAARILRESATLGVRMHHAERLKAGRETHEIETPLGPARVKLKIADGAIIGVAPEYEDCRALAEKLGLPVETVMARVTQAARAHFRLDDADQEQ